VTIKNPSPRPVQDPLPDLPLIREELLAEIEQRQRAGAPGSELADLRQHYREVVRGDDGRP
jgi:hypothetical protein